MRQFRTKEGARGGSEEKAKGMSGPHDGGEVVGAGLQDVRGKREKKEEAQCANTCAMLSRRCFTKEFLFSPG